MLQYKIPFLYLTFICWINISKIYLTMILISFYSYEILPLFLYHGNTDGNCSLCKYWNMNQIEFLSHFFSCIFVICVESENSWTFIQKKIMGIKFDLLTTTKFMNYTYFSKDLFYLRLEKPSFYFHLERVCCYTNWQ